MSIEILCDPSSINNKTLNLYANSIETSQGISTNNIICETLVATTSVGTSLINAADINTSALNFTVPGGPLNMNPQTSGSTGDVLHSDGSGNVSWIDSTGYVVSWGGEVGVLNEYLAFNGISNTILNATPQTIFNIYKHPRPIGMQLTSCAIMSTSGNNTTVFDIILNNGIVGSITLTAPRAVYNLQPLLINIAQNDEIEIRQVAGTLSNRTIFSLYLR